MNYPDNLDYPLYTKRGRHPDDTVLGTLGLILLVLVGCAIVYNMRVDNLPIGNLPSSHGSISTLGADSP